ncbi:hypothetical protein M8C21_033859, partial [Ambrosia artemisiifolia]
SNYGLAYEIKHSKTEPNPVKKCSLQREGDTCKDRQMQNVVEPSTFALPPNIATTTETVPPTTPTAKTNSSKWRHHGYKDEEA